MNVKRRDFIKGATTLSISAGLGPLAFPAFGDLDFSGENGPEVELFEQAQQKLLDKYAAATRSLYVKMKKPDLSAHILEVGKGDPVVIIHGGGAYACQFASLMGALQNDFQLFVPDRPGCGLTDMINYSGVPFRQHAVDFVTGIMDSLKLDKAALIGNSMGGYWALLFALACPERVSRLVLIGEPAGSSPPGTVPMAPPANKNPSLEAVRGIYQFVLVADINRVPQEILAADLAAAKIPGAAVAWDTMVDQFRNNKDLGTYALRPELKNLKPETLFIWGEKDKFGPPKLGQEMASIIPNGRCEIVQDAGHLLWLDQLERCASMTIEFLKR